MVLLIQFNFPDEPLRKRALYLFCVSISDVDYLRKTVFCLFCVNNHNNYIHILFIINGIRLFKIVMKIGNSDAFKLVAFPLINESC